MSWITPLIPYQPMPTCDVRTIAHLASRELAWPPASSTSCAAASAPMACNDNTPPNSIWTGRGLTIDCWA